ncbi:MAG: 4Fe-4S dicluster domain-containing protein [Deltaproteobacteria bacterium]|nr:4Fe-4S dicluster domain-containing protein [Deltaproteobacteria bacterium]
MTRRKFLGWIGAAAGAGAVMGGSASAASTKHFKGYPGSLGVLHDITRCIGCRQCERACNTVNALPEPQQPFDDLSVLNQERRTTSHAYTVVNRFQGEDKAHPTFVKIQCNHCLEPACASVCFVKAFRKDRTGAVTYDASLCVGCRYCMIACPFNIPAYEYNKAFTPRVMKCTLCLPRIEKGLLPGCVASCPKEALTFGPREKLIKEARRRIQRFPQTYVDHIYGETEMGGTSWLYLSARPFGELGMREDLGIQPAPSLTAGPLSAVPIVVGLWPVLLTGIYAISRRKDQIAAQERIEAIAATVADANEEMKVKLAELKDKMNKEKEAAINLEVKKALEEAAKPSEAEKQPAEEIGAAEKRKEEK